MKIKLLLFFFLLSLTSGWAQVAGWDFFGESSPTTSTADVFSSNLDSSNLITRGGGAAASAASNSFRTLGFKNDGISTANTDYFQITLSASSGNLLSLSTIDARLAGTATFAASPGVSSQFAYSLNGTTFVLIGSPQVTVGTPAILTQIDLTGIPALQNIPDTVTVTIRYYASGQTTTGGWGFTSLSSGAYGLVIGGTVSAATPSPEIDVTGNANSIVNLDTTPSATDNTDFGLVPVGSSIQHSFVVNNTGTANLGVSAVSILGANAADFSVVTSPVGAIAAGLDASLAIKFSPSASGLRTAKVSIANTDGNENPFEFAIQGNGLCSVGVVSSVYPASGPVGTEVTINVSSGSLSATSATFNGIPATVVSSSASQLVITVPAGAETGNITITNGSGCKAVVPFTVIVQDKTSCEGSTNITDLFISEVTDASSGSLSYIEIYNATGATVNMANYEVRIRNNGGGTGDDIPLVGTLLNGESFTLATSVGAPCSVPGGNGELADQHGVSSGINDNDCIHLAKNGTIIDTWGVCNGSTWIGAAGLGTKGYDFERKNTVPAPTTTFSLSDWTTTDWDLCSDDYSNIASYGGVSSPPIVAIQPVLNLTCSSTNAVLAVTGLQGFAGGRPLAYQWYVVAPNSVAWTAIMNGGVYSGATSSILTISSIAGLEGYQYYCQVREDLATCYTATKSVILKDTFSTTWNGSGWSNGLPTLSKSAIINGNYTTAVNGNFSCCSLKTNATFTLAIAPNGYVEVANSVNNNGSIVVENNGQLLQINESDNNTGTYAGTAFQVKRTVNNLRGLDYVYWSAPVDSYNISGINGSLRYYWNTTAANPNGTQGYWLSASGAMAKGQGYIVRGPSSFTTPQSLTVNFTGKPFNGQFTYPVTRGTNTASLNDNLIFVGNPYPSALDADLFLAANPNIEGAVHIWTHGTLPSSAIVSPFYQNFTANYTMSDYIVYNGTATTIPGAFDGTIASGQGFFIKMLETGAASQNVVFRNAMRGSTLSGGVLNNTQFFRNEHTTAGSVEKHRIWLDLINASNQVSTTVVGYVTGATMAKDNRYDAYAKLNEGLCFYSRIENEAIHIQGRSLPFHQEDQVALGMEIPASGNFKIGIRYVDGLFSGNQNIYLEDKKINIIHDLKASAYAFVVDEAGFVNNRFVLRFTDKTLGNESFESTPNSVLIYANESINVKSSSFSVKEVMVYDVLGRVVAQEKCDSKDVAIKTVSQTQSTLIVKVRLANNQILTRKIVY